ncbi:MAG: hypothetical protein ACK5JS_08440 [Mangrovibacterium sp.]
MKDECPFCGSENTYHNGSTYECLDCKRRYSSVGRKEKTSGKKERFSSKFVDDDEDYNGDFKFGNDDFDSEDFDIADDNYYDDEDDY